MASKALEITKEKVLKASEKCPQAKEVLKELFSEVFEDEGNDITEEIKWSWKKMSNNKYFLNGYHEGNQVFYVSGVMKGIQILDDENKKYKIEIHEDTFCIFKRN